MTEILKDKRIISYITLSFVLFLLFGLLRGSSWQGSTQLHTLMELIATILALFVGIVALVRYYSRKTNTILFVGVGFLGTALLDGYHTIVTSTFFNQLWPSPPPSLIPWSWNASRIFLSVLMLFSLLAWRWEEKHGERGRIGEKKIFLLTGFFTLGSFLFFAFYPLPRAYYQGNIVGRPEEFISAVFFLIALILYLKKGGWRKSKFEHWVVMSLIVGFMGQAMFMPFSFRLFDPMFDLAHLLKKVSYICVLIGLLVSMYYLFKQAEEMRESIARANDRMQKEIDDRKSMEVVLREMASFAEFNPAPVIRFNSNGRITQANPTSYKIFDEAQLTGQTIQDILPALSKIDLEEYIRNGKIDVFEQTIGGKNYQFIIKGVPDLGMGNVYGSDITDRKLAENIQSVLFKISEATGTSRSLEELFGIIHSQLSLLIDTGNFYISLYDKERDIYSFPYIVDEYDEVVDFTPQQLRKSLTDYVRKTGTSLLVTPPVHRKLIQMGEVGIVGEPAAQWLGAPLKTPNGAIGVVAVQSYSDPSIYSEKDLELLTFVSEHIAIAIDRKRSEEELKLSKFTIEHSSESMFWIGPDAGFLHVNDYACRVLGYSREELLSMTVHDIDPNFPEGIWPDHWRELKKKGSLIVETIHRTKSGNELPVEVSANYLKYDGEEYNFAFARDITERKKVDRIKDEFIATVSHEIRTPLTSIHGALDLIDKGLAGEIPEKPMNLIKIAKRNSERLRLLIEDMLDIQKIESGKIQFRMKPLDLKPLLEMSLENNESFGEQFNVEFVLDDIMPDVKVNADSNRLKQVMDNLLSNAAKFSPRNGEVKVSIARHNDSIRVSVKDYGPGIPENFRDKIFQKFTQADSSKTREKGGTGLGMSIAKSIIEQHGGTIGFETELNVGTTFYFELPEWKASRDS